MKKSFCFVNKTPRRIDLVGREPTPDPRPSPGPPGPSDPDRVTEAPVLHGGRRQTGAFKGSELSGGKLGAAWTAASSSQRAA